MTSNTEKELWQQCIDWIKSTGVLPFDAEFDRLADFAYILRNGVILCQLAIKLSPNCIYSHEILSQYQHSHFVCSKNIALFLNACRDHFSINEVFSEDDLLELQNFPAVLRLLSQLSRSQKSRQLGLKPFPEETILSSKLTFRDDDPDDIYLNLKEQVEQQQQNTEFDTYVVLNKQREEEEERTGQEIYESICSQKIPRNRSLPNNYIEFVPSNNREHCLKELLDTEMSYLNGIQTIIDRFYNPLRFHLPSADFTTIFINIFEILCLHRNFLPELTQAVIKSLGLNFKEEVELKDLNGSSLVADVFFKFKMNFTIYGLFCSQLGSSSRRIEEMERIDLNYKRLIEELGKNLQFKLRDFLILPFQRITKYHLILENLFKNTSDLTEKKMLNEAFEAMKDVAVYVNEMKRDQEIIGCINTIERSISDLNLNLLHYGRFIFDGTIKITITENGNVLKSKQRSVFLFESMLLFAKRETGIYKSKNVFFLADFDFYENNNNEFPTLNKYNTISRKLTNINLFDLNVNYSNSCSFLIEKRRKEARTNCEILNNNNILFTFKNVNDMNNWKQMIKKAIEISNPKEASVLGHSLLYKTYNCVTICSFCQKFLLGKFFQGYHCSGCNKDLHFECTKKIECCCFSSNKMLKNDLINCENSSRITRRLSSIFPQQQQQTFNKLNENNLNINQHLQNINNTILSLNFSTTNGHGEGREKIIINNNNNFNTIDYKKRYSRTSNCSLSDVITLNNDNNDSTSLLSSPTQQQKLQQTSFSVPSTPSTKIPLIVSSRIMETFEISPERQNIPEEYPWFFGQIGRKIANNLLEGTEAETFLVRWSPEKHQYVLSLQIGNGMKHIKINFDENINRYFLHSERFFDSVVDLVNFYRENSINEGFPVDAKLTFIPLKSAIFRAERSFSRPDTSKYLTLIPGDIIYVLDTIGEDKGWWKGSINGQQCGYFPFSFVKPEQTEQQKYYSNLINFPNNNNQNNNFIINNSSNNNKQQQIPHLTFEEEQQNEQQRIFI